MFRFAHPGLLYLLAVIPLLVLFYVVMRHRKKKAIAEFGNPELLAPLMPLLSFRRGAWKFVMILLALFFVIVVSSQSEDTALHPDGCSAVLEETTARSLFHFLRRHYPDQVQGTGDSFVCLCISAGNCAPSAPVFDCTAVQCLF